MFWFFCSFQAEDAFTQFRPLFNQQNVLAENDDYGSNGWEQSGNQIIARDLLLEGIGERSSYKEFLLNIDDNEASIRLMLPRLEAV